MEKKIINKRSYYEIQLDALNSIDKLEDKKKYMKKIDFSQTIEKDSDAATINAIKVFEDLVKSRILKGPDNKPTPKVELLLDSNGRSVSNLSQDIADILSKKDVLFYRPDSKQIIEIVQIKFKDKEGKIYTGFREMKDKRFVTLLEKYFEVGYVRKTRYGEVFEIKSLSPNKAGIVLCSHILEDALPQIERIFKIPLPIMYEDKLTFPEKGYDKRFNSWRPYDSPEIKDPNMPLKDAKKIFEKIFSEFCFKSEQDKTNALAGLITPYLRGLFGAFNERTPVFFYLGNRERCGKDYLAGITGILFEGANLEDNPISSGEKSGNNNEELRKKITSAIINGRSRMHFGNNRGFINNAVFEQVITTKYYSDRILGKNELVNLPNEMDFSLSGNVGVTYTPDLANRCKFVNLFLEIEDANSREFKNPDLHKWVLDNRDLILSALYSLVKNWFEKKCPKGSVPFASFPEWSDVCGGVLEEAGYENPCVQDKESLSLAGDSETSDMKTLFELCYVAHPNQPIKKDEIIRLIKSEEGIFSYIDFENRRGQTQFALKLRRFIGRILSGVQLKIADPSVKRVARQEYMFTKSGNMSNVGNVSPFYHVEAKKLNRGIQDIPTIPMLPKGDITPQRAEDMLKQLEEEDVESD